jgi:REP element-mobilizing transposase RayT
MSAILDRGALMPRGARKKSNTGIYHVVLRGINKQRIFEDEQDYRKFLEIIKSTQDKSGYLVYAYCLMSNHIHLLIKEGTESLGNTFRRIGASFVYWYNWKYNRRGHLFQDRYKSEPVETDSYFLTVLRYIHQNPIKAGIVREIAQYLWSSYQEYTTKQEICNTTFALKMFSEDYQEALELWQKFNHTENNDQCLEYDDGTRLNDLEATELIQEITGVTIPAEIQRYEKQKRNRVIKKLKEQGLPIRQLARLTGISYGVIRGV